jgi:uroporphyrinogen decarboxylase
VLAQLPRERDGQLIPKIIFTKGGGAWLEAMAESGADVVGLDWTTDLHAARERVGRKVALQGHLDPMVLMAPPEIVAAETRAVLDRFGRPQRADGGWDGHVFNLGHGISQSTPPESVEVLVDTVHAWSRTLRSPAAGQPVGKTSPPVG